MSSRDKLNAVHLSGSIGLAAIFGAMAGSWVIFVLVAITLIGTSIATGQIRFRR